MTTEKEKAPKYTKYQVLKSQAYMAYHEVFSVALEDGKEYTRSQLEKIKDDFLKKSVDEVINGKE